MRSAECGMRSTECGVRNAERRPELVEGCGMRSGEMDRRCIVPDDGPSAVGPYSPAVVAGGLVFVSGQIPQEPGTGKLVTESFEAQCVRVFENLKTVLEAAGASLDSVVKVTVFLTDLEQFDEMNSVYERYFGTSKPARACIQAARLPKDVAIEADAIAVLS